MPFLYSGVFFCSLLHLYVLKFIHVVVCSFTSSCFFCSMNALCWLEYGQLNLSSYFLYLFIFPPIIFISWRLITLQYCSGFRHTLTWISHGFTCVANPEPPSHRLPCPIPLGRPSAPAPSPCLMHPTWTSDLFHPW